MSDTATHCNKHEINNCNDCRLADICLPISLELDDINQLDSIIKRGQILQKGQTLFKYNAPFHSVYAVRSGALKTLTQNTAGQEQVTAFYLPGEIAGLDGLASNHHTNHAIALETSSICEIPFSQFEVLSLKIPSIQRRFFQIMGQEIHHDQQLISLLANKSADEKVAALLLSISMRHKACGLSALQFNLPMSRSEIGNYLGLTIETVSRVFTRLAKREIITLDKKTVSITHLNTLKTLSAG